MALTRARAAEYDVHETSQMKTGDNEDHTFCGVMFSILVKADLPVVRTYCFEGRLARVSTSSFIPHFRTS
jgi:hypothetical protein